MCLVIYFRQCQTGSVGDAAGPNRVILTGKTTASF